MKIRVAVLLTSLFIICSGCSSNNTSGELDYEKTKKMIVDILKTDDGKKAIKEVLSDESLKSELIMNQDIVTKTVKETLTSKKGKDFWEEAFKDPKFTAAYAKSLETEHKRLMKDLTKDPDYRSMIVEIMKEPDLKKEFTELLKTKEMRKIYKDTILETGKSPLVEAKMEELLTKAATKAVKKTSEKKQ
jgi:spore germination protein D